MRVFILGHGWERFPGANAYWEDSRTGWLTLTDIDFEQQSLRRTVAIFPPGEWLAIAALEPGDGLRSSPLGAVSPQVTR